MKDIVINVLVYIFLFKTFHHRIGKVFSENQKAAKKNEAYDFCSF